MDARIGTLNNGKFYAFVNGCDQAEFVGTLAEVETALGLRSTDDRYTVTIRFQYPAWDETKGIVYNEVLARSKSEAIAAVRIDARNDGHTGTGKGRITFTAELEA